MVALAEASCARMRRQGGRIRLRVGRAQGGNSRRERAARMELVKKLDVVRIQASLRQMVGPRKMREEMREMSCWERERVGRGWKSGVGGREC